MIILSVGVETDINLCGIQGSIPFSFLLRPKVAICTQCSQANSLSPIRMRKKYTRVNILRCVFIRRCANQPESKSKLRSHGFYRQEYFCR